MRNIKPRAKYQSISLTEDFITAIKNVIMSDPKYKSIAEYTRDAIREKMESDKFGGQSPIQKFFMEKAKRNEHIIDIEDLDKKIEALSERIVTRDDMEELVTSMLHDLGFTSKEKEKKNDNSNGVRI